MCVSALPRSYGYGQIAQKDNFSSLIPFFVSLLSDDLALHGDTFGWYSPLSRVVRVVLDARHQKVEWS